MDHFSMKEEYRLSKLISDLEEENEDEDNQDSDTEQDILDEDRVVGLISDDEEDEFTEDPFTDEELYLDRARARRSGQLILPPDPESNNQSNSHLAEVQTPRRPRASTPTPRKGYLTPKVSRTRSARSTLVTNDLPILPTPRLVARPQGLSLRNQVLEGRQSLRDSQRSLRDR